MRANACQRPQDAGIEKGEDMYIQPAPCSILWYNLPTPKVRPRCMPMMCSSPLVDSFLLKASVARKDDRLSTGTRKGLGNLAFAIGADGGADGHEEAGGGLAVQGAWMVLLTRMLQQSPPCTGQESSACHWGPGQI